MNRILLISSSDNDLAGLILRTARQVVLLSPAARCLPDGDFDALCVLGGDGDKPLVLPAGLRLAMEQFRKEGKPVFAEFVGSIGQCYAGEPTEMTHHRMVFDGAGFAAEGLCDGDVLDGHDNHCISYHFMPSGITPVLAYHDYICAHDHIRLSDEQKGQGRPALWLLDDHTLVCGFRLCNFRRARLAPRTSWERLITAVLSFLCGEAVEPVFDPPVCSYQPCRVTDVSDVGEAVRRGLGWFSRSGQLRDGGCGGVYEGFSHLVRAQDGVQLRAPSVRTDCSGEVAGAFLVDYMAGGDRQSYDTFCRIDDFCFDLMQVKEGAHRGMMRWTETAFEVCYQDDAARAILPTLLYQNFGGEAPHFREALEALDYMLQTTDEDGLRAFRTDICQLNEQVCADLRKKGAGIPSAHYNAYYHAALLLAYRAGAPKRYLEVAERGLTSLMALYPNTRRETSETEECCRLVFPLAVLYGVTGKAEHYGWLCRAVDDLSRLRHASGGYAEWDTDYRAACSRNHTGECALLADNGDPVCDLLYSNNWLPLGFAYAYLATGERRFFDLWADIASFLVSCQIHSDDPNLDGAWTRAFDMERFESYGVPHDVGWAPCCIETGWTMGEILMGLRFMQVVERSAGKEN